MHLSDPLLSLPVGLSFWAISAMALRSATGTKDDDPESFQVPLAGVMSAFVFAAQMVNFAIPGTGSSGHLGGGLLMACLIGPRRAFLAMASVLLIQCLLFADGGILALGCNLFNMAILPTFVVYSLIRGWNDPQGLPRAWIVVTGGILALMLGSGMVGLQVILSGRTSIPLIGLWGFLLSIHFVIGVVEGFATWGILRFLHRTRPRLVAHDASTASAARLRMGFLVAVALGLGASASAKPDGLEWALAKFGPPPVGAPWQNLTDRFSPFAGYEIPSWFPNNLPWPAVDSGGSILDALVFLGFAIATGMVLRRGMNR